MTPPPLQLRCRDLAAYEDICVDLGIPEGAFGFHSYGDLDEPCHCDEQSQYSREDWRRCDSASSVVRSGFVLIVCCRCFDNAGADDDVLAEVGRRVAIAERARLDRAAEREALRLTSAAGGPQGRAVEVALLTLERGAA